ALAILFSLVAGCDARLAGDLTERQANEIIVALHARGIPAKKEPAAGARGEPRYEIEVPEAEVAEALGALASVGLPRREETGLEEAFAGGGLVPSATEERARLLAALGGELARTLERIDGVVDARVHVALPDPSETLLDETPPSPRASVLVKHRVDYAPPDAESIRAVVAGAVQGLDTTSVSVLTIVGDPGSPAVSLTRVGPISVGRGSAPLLKAVLATSLAIHVVLASLLVAVLRRHRRPKRASALHG
ncbi:MAG: hypothetical protein H5U40_10080, partial [Polyangiaceae bacterium]|nr:hypothetical protein [Polyangiaceae bacterium]